MKVAVVRLPDGQLRTVKLKEFEFARQRAIAGMRNPPEMGRNMTTDSPAVRKVQAESEPVSGQVPEVKVKQEPPQVKSELAQPPAPVKPEDAARIGQPDPESGRAILQPSNDVIQNERLANESAPDLTTRLSRIAASVEGAKLDRLRPQKGLERLQEKVASGKPAQTIGDNLAAQIVADTVEAKNQLIERLQQEFPVISVDDKFTQPREKAGYPSANIQVQMPNGGTAEVQIVTPEIQAITDQTHALYTAGRRFPEGSANRAWYWNEAARMHAAALQRFKAREAVGVTIGQKVVLRNGEPAEVVGVEPKFNRVVVRTSGGLRTVRPGEVSLLRPQGSVPQMPKLIGPKANPKIRALLETFVPLSPERILEVAGKVHSDVEQGGNKLPDIIWVNHPAMHLMWDFIGNEERPFAGIYLDADSCKKFARYFEKRSEELERAGLRVESAAAATLAKHIREVSAKEGAVAIVLRTGVEAYDRATVREERGHVIQDRVGGGHIYEHANLAKLWMEPEFKKASDTLVRMGYRNKPLDLVIEAAIRLLAGEGRSLSLSNTESKFAIKKYLKSIIEERGADAAEDLKLVAEPEYHKIFDEAKNETRSRETQSGK